MIYETMRQHKQNCERMKNMGIDSMMDRFYITPEVLVELVHEITPESVETRYKTLDINNSGYFVLDFTLEGLEVTCICEERKYSDIKMLLLKLGVKVVNILED